jgi:hypothetical protein
MTDDPRDPARLDELGEPIMPAWWRRLASWWAWLREPDPAPRREPGVVPVDVDAERADEDAQWARYFGDEPEVEG